MRKAINYIILMLCMSLVACSDDSKTELTTVDAQKAYNDAKGTYKGIVLDGNIPSSIYLTLGNELTVRDLPVTPLLQKYFSGAELTEANTSVKERLFKLPSTSMMIYGELVYVYLEPTDWIFTVYAGGKEYKISALMSATVCYNHTYEILSASINVDELYCNSKKADLSSNRITWIIDEAKKQ
jgi:hypothetical protein